MPMSRLLAGTRVMSWPPTATRPPSASSSPARIRSAVVLPQPDGPSSATSSPGSMRQRRGRRGRARCRSCGAGPSAGRRRPGWRRRRGRARGWTFSSPWSGGRGGRCRRRTWRTARRNANSSAASETATEIEASRLPSRLIATCRLLRLSRRGDGELAEHQRHRQERREQDGRADVGQDHPPHHGEPARAEGAGRLGQRRARRWRDSPASSAR